MESNWPRAEEPNTVLKVRGSTSVRSWRINVIIVSIMIVNKSKITYRLQQQQYYYHYTR